MQSSCALVSEDGIPNIGPAHLILLLEKKMAQKHVLTRGQLGDTDYLD